MFFDVKILITLWVDLKEQYKIIKRQFMAPLKSEQILKHYSL